MAPITLPLFTPDETARRAHSFDCAGYAIGRDYARHRLTPPVEHLQQRHPVRRGWDAGRAAFRGRTRPATPQVRRWLELRLNAWLHGDAFEEVQVTPHLLGQLDAGRCPITREALDHDTGRAGHGVLERVCDGAGYAAGNLAVMSARACDAKAGHDWHDAWAWAQQLEADAGATLRGLDGAQWMRLAVLMSFVTPLPHAQAAALPLAVLPPNRLRVLNPVQALQTVLTLQFTREGYAQRINEIAALVPGAEARDAFRVFMHTLLARWMDAGRQDDAAAVREALEDAWRHPLVNRRWQRLALLLTPAQCERLVEQAIRRGCAVGGFRWMDDDAAVDGWAVARPGERETRRQPRAGTPMRMQDAPLRTAA